MTVIEVPKLNNNDTEYVLVEWLVGDGNPAVASDPLVLIETSKALEELPCPAGGYLLRVVPAGEHCRPGEVIGHVFTSAEERVAHLAALPATEAVRDPGAGRQEQPGAPVLTASARAFATAHGVSDEQLRGLGLALIRRSDLDKLVTPGEPGDDEEIRPLGSHQQAVAAAVAESLRTVPAASAYIKVVLDQSLTVAAAVSQREGTFLGVPDLLIAATGRLHERHRLFYATLLAEGRVRLARAPHVGVTMDLGRGLFVPVVHDAERRAVQEIAGLLMHYRMLAARGTFREKDIQGANIVVALHNEADVLLAQPVIFPGQVCVVSLGGVQEELVLGADGRPAVRRVAHVGVTYDHRVVNGRDALAFLKDIKAALEDPAALLPAGV